MSAKNDRDADTYARLRSELERMADQFLECSRRLPNLHFDLLLAPGFEAIGEEPWQRLRDRIEEEISRRKDHREVWFVLKGGCKCGRCYGDPKELDQFQRLAVTADYLLHKLAELPQDFGQEIGQFENRGMSSWLTHVFWTANMVNSTLLYQIRDPSFEARIIEIDPVEEVDLEDEEDDDNPIGSSALIHPECFRLYPDVFLASYEAIKIWLNPMSRLSLTRDGKSGELLKSRDLSPIILPPPKLKPKWVNEARGVLTYRGVTIKVIVKSADNVRPILDAFEASGWENEIPNPLLVDRKSDDPTQLRNAVDSLNDRHAKPRQIIFGTKDSYRLVTWKALDQGDA